MPMEMIVALYWCRWPNHKQGLTTHWKEYHIRRLPLGKTLNAHTKGERIAAQPIISRSPCWLHHWETTYRIKKKIGSTHSHQFQEGGNPLHFAKDHHSMHSHKGSHKEAAYKKKQYTQCPHTASPHVVRKGKLNLIYLSVNSLLWIKKLGFCLV